jgi:hypothetical protein
MALGVADSFLMGSFTDILPWLAASLVLEIAGRSRRGEPAYTVS